MKPRNRKRLALVLIVALFAAPLVAAIVLHAIGWEPVHTRNSGKLVEPPRDLQGARFEQADGSALQWNDENRAWTLFALPNGACESACLGRLDELRRVRLSLNQNAYRVRVVVLGELDAQALQGLEPLKIASDPAGALADLRPQQSGDIAAALVDPRGFLALHYPAGYDAGGLRKDLARLVKR